jgi:hypothetical protein
MQKFFKLRTVYYGNAGAKGVWQNGLKKSGLQN